MGKKQKHSDPNGHRQSPRIKANALVKYIAFDNKGMDTDYGEGRAINLSQNGILLETLKPLKGVVVLLMTIDLDGKEVKVRGRIVSSNTEKITGYYFSGISFIGSNDQQITAVTEENQKHSGTSEQRRNPRIETFNLVSYILFDKNGKAVDRGKGRTINLSQNGILLETLNPLNDALVMLMTIDIDGKEVRIKGRVIYSELQVTTGFYVSGIDFIGQKEHQVTAIVAFIKAYFFNKSKGIIPELTDISTIDSK
jgi:hypothetical protein